MGAGGGREHLFLRIIRIVEEDRHSCQLCAVCREPPGDRDVVPNELLRGVAVAVMIVGVETPLERFCASFLPRTLHVTPVLSAPTLAPWSPKVAADSPEVKMPFRCLCSSSPGI